MDAPDSTLDLLHKHLQPNGKVPGSLLIPTLPPHNALGVLARTPRYPLQSVHLSKGFLFPSKTGIHGFLSVPSFSSKGTRKRRNASRGVRREVAVAETRGGRLAHLESVLARMWPTMSAWSCALAVAVIAAFANAAGTGGGPLFVPLLGVLLKIDTRDAAALSQSLVFFGSITSTIMHANRKHPLLADRPCLDAGLVLALQPMFMAGVGYGVVVNTTAPNELVCTSLMLVLTMVAAMTMRKGLSMWRKEGREGRTVQYSTYFSSVSGLFAEENRIMQADAGVTDPEARIGLPSSPRMETPLLKKDRNGDESTPPAPTESERCVLEEAHASPVASNEPLTPGGVETKSINMDHQRSFLCGCGLIAAASWACFLLIAIVRAAWKHDCGALYWGSLVLELPVALVWEKVALWWVHSPSGTGLTLLNEFLEPNHLVSGDPGGSSSISRRSTPSVIQVYSAADLTSIDDSMSRGNVQSGTETLAKHASTSEESVDRLVRVRLQHDPDADADAGEVWTGISVLPPRNKENLGLLPEHTSMHPPVEPHAMLLDEERQRLSRPSELASAETARGDPVPAPISDPQPSIVQGKKQKELGLLPIWALAGGVAAGALGFGGSVVLGPLLLSLNVHPQVTAAVCSAIVFCSSSLAALQYWLAERIAPLEAVGYGLAAMGGSTLGVLWISAAIRRTGRASITVLLLSALIGSSALVVLIFKFVPAVERGDMRFHPLCGAT